jgi:hypothetical protein
MLSGDESPESKRIASYNDPFPHPAIKLFSLKSPFFLPLQPCQFGLQELVAFFLTRKKAFSRNFH